MLYIRPNGQQAFKLTSVNVIEYCGETVQSLRAFVDTPEGNKAAEELFLRCVEENTCHWSDMDDEEKASLIEEGEFTEDNYQVFLTHSI